jgi:hypothetical protein
MGPDPETLTGNGPVQSTGIEPGSVEEDAPATRDYRNLLALPDLWENKEDVNLSQGAGGQDLTDDEQEDSGDEVVHASYQDLAALADQSDEPALGDTEWSYGPEHFSFLRDDMFDDEDEDEE